MKFPKFTLLFTLACCMLSPNYFSQNHMNDLNRLCGSYQLLEFIDAKSPGYLQNLNEKMADKQQRLALKSREKSDDIVYTIPVVFHVVYNNEDENIPDSVLLDQLEVMNQAFRRTTPDTVDTRSAFLPYVGDSKIQFELATVDPNGNATTGITRTPTSITHFAGVMPYALSQSTAVSRWLVDSLYNNLFRIADDDRGGSTPWDPERYLNIWVGDLRGIEPNNNNLERIHVLAFASSPDNHPNFAGGGLEGFFGNNQGVFAHYVVVGSNNRLSFPSPYTGYNGLLSGGKSVVHEIGHYLGLRHVWGDGPCSSDDYVDDTPRGNASSSLNCNFFANSCIDNIDGQDLPDMVENYMDYSSGSCQNSFTNGQIAVMRDVLESYRTLLSNPYMESLQDQFVFEVYPNPSSGNMRVSIAEPLIKPMQWQISDRYGRLVKSGTIKTQEDKVLALDELSAGAYFFTLETEAFNKTKMILIQ